MPIASIDRIPPKELAGHAVLVRIDAEDDIKLRDSLPTVALASEAGARAIVATHYGLPPNAPRADALGARLSEQLGRPVGKLDDWKDEAGLAAVSHLAEGEIVLIENLAFEDGEDAGDDKPAEALGPARRDLLQRCICAVAPDQSLDRRGRQESQARGRRPRIRA